MPRYSVGAGVLWRLPINVSDLSLSFLAFVLGETRLISSSFFSSLFSSGLGTDCSSLTGVRMGAVTCDRGRCIVSACRPGFTLRDGRCL